nr:MAG TPA: hypothetical protein [Caudoviricetes sp.]
MFIYGSYEYNIILSYYLIVCWHICLNIVIKYLYICLIGILI